MKIEKNSFRKAAEKIGLTQDIANQFWDELKNDSNQKLDLPHVLYYAGGLLVILAMTWLFGTAWDRFGGMGIFLIGLSYFFIFFTMGATCWKKTFFRNPGGLFITISVCMIPLIVYGFQSWTGWWTYEQPASYRDFFYWIKSEWFLMEIATLVGGSFTLYFYRFPFLEPV